MIPCQPTIKKLALVVFILSIGFVNISAQDGKQLFNTNCASCHGVDQPSTGPALRGLESRGPWADRKELYAWVHNPSAYKTKGDAYITALDKQYTASMQAFPTMAEKDIDAIVEYINTAPLPGQKKEDKEGGGGGSGSNNGVIFGVISLIMAIIALILMQVNSNLKKLSDDKEGIGRPEPVPFYRNKIYIALVTVIVFILIGFYVTQAGIGLNRQKNFQPHQPIYYSHKVHAGLNQISCLYCHGNAWESKHAAVPSTNVCMNCHKNIQSYTKGPQLFDANGAEINGTAEIQKLYKYAGFDPAKPDQWDPSKAKSIPWEKIHNLPDHVYFNHSQHVRAGNVQCQTCHGNITEMDEVKQFSELSMGWCINCHRQTKVNFNYDSTGNKFYSIYKKFHDDLRTDTVFEEDGKTIRKIIGPRMDSVRVIDIGGLECQKCHY